MKTTTLTTVKKATTKPSNVVIILQDSDKLALAPVIDLANNLFTFEKAHAKQGLLLSEMRLNVAHSFCALMSDNEATYDQAQAYKKHLFETVASAQGVTLEHITKTLTKLISDCVKEGAYDYTAWTVSPKASAVSMTKAREALAIISDIKLASDIQANAKAGNYKAAADLAKEVERRAKVKATEVKRTEGKATTALKNDIKAFITAAEPEVLAAFIYTQNNIEQILKLAKQAS